MYWLFIGILYRGFFLPKCTLALNRTQWEVRVNCQKYQNRQHDIHLRGRPTGFAIVAKIAIVGRNARLTRRSSRSVQAP